MDVQEIFLLLSAGLVSVVGARNLPEKNKRRKRGVVSVYLVVDGKLSRLPPVSMIRLPVQSHDPAA
jgi:hypothetical protein